MIISLRLIPPEGLDLAESEDPSIIDLDDPAVVFSQPIVCQMRAVLVGGMVLVRGQLETTARLACARCLEEFDYHIQVNDFSRELEVAQVGETLSLTEDIREDIILALPIKPLCRLDCRGVCPVCGAGLNEGECGCSTSDADSPFAELNRIMPEKKKG